MLDKDVMICECEQCKAAFEFRLGMPITLQCQKCGSKVVKVKDRVITKPLPLIGVITKDGQT